MEATANFDKMIKRAVDSLLDSVKRIEHALEYESERITELVNRNNSLELKMDKMEKEMEVLKSDVARHNIDVNKTERLSRRNNFRIVGVPEEKGQLHENCAHIVENIIKEDFKLNIQVERAHRDGKIAKRPRHITY